MPSLPCPAHDPCGSGLSGGSKMKDWDREQAVNSDEEHLDAPRASGDGSSDGDEGADEGW